MPGKENLQGYRPLSMTKWKVVAVDRENVPGLKKSLLNINTPDEYEMARSLKE